MVLWLSPESVRLSATAEDDAVQLYAGLAPTLFSEFRVESRASNVICAELLGANLMAALRAAAGAPAAVLKLIKLGTVPYLSVAADIVSGGVVASQEVPVRIIGTEELERYREPSMSPIAARLTFPSPAAVLSVVDHMRGLLQGASRAGGGGGLIRLAIDPAQRKVILAARTATVQVKTYFKELIASGSGGGGGGGGDDNDVESPNGVSPMEMHVSSKHLLAALKAIRTLESSMLLCVVPGRALILHGENAARTATLTFILALIDSASDV